MLPDQHTLKHASFREPLAPGNQEIYESLYWYPNELAVTVQAATPPTLKQLRHLSARLNRLLSRVGISVLPFYSGGQRVSRGGARFGPMKKRASVEELEVGMTPLKMEVEEDLDTAWRDEVDRCRKLKSPRFSGVHSFGMGTKGITVVFYALRTHHRHSDEQRDTVQLAVDLINQNLQLFAPRKGEPDLKEWNPRSNKLDQLLAGINPADPQNVSHQQPLRILAAMPNWLTSPFQYGAQPPSGPGAPPLQAPAMLRQWDYNHAVFKKVLSRTKDSPERVTVIVLDTALWQDSHGNIGKDAIIAAANRYLPHLPKGSLLQQIVDDLNNGDMTIDVTSPTISDWFRAGLDEYGRPYGYNMVDHGLFVAGIIRGILPNSKQAQIKLIRIQNDYGSGEMDLFLGALGNISNNQPNLDHVVLNLSLGVLPPLEELPTIWFGSGCCEGPDLTTMMNTIDLLHLGVRLPIQTLVDQNVVIVAAAGNDSLGKNPPHGPRLPARYDDVLGVAAVDQEGEAAGYSNRANLFHCGSGIAAYGGEQPNDDSETLAWLAGKKKKAKDVGKGPDAVHGLYLNDAYPALNADETGSHGRNEYGCAWWSGTSFATPVASGLAAHYILDGKHGQEVIQAILEGLATDPNTLYEPRLQAPVLMVEKQ